MEVVGAELRSLCQGWKFSRFEDARQRRPHRQQRAEKHEPVAARLRHIFQTLTNWKMPFSVEPDSRHCRGQFGRHATSMCVLQHCDGCLSTVAKSRHVTPKCRVTVYRFALCGCVWPQPPCCCHFHPRWRLPRTRETSCVTTASDVRALLLRCS